MAFLLAPAWAAQTDQSALDWAVAQRARYEKFKEPVITVYATARLAEIVCPIDRGAGGALYRDALQGLSLLTPKRFTDPLHVLPIASFTALWKSATGNAYKCDPSLEESFDTERARAKMQTERQAANNTIRLAFDRIKDYPDRAGQLAEAAITATDPDHLDISLLTRFLSQLRERAPDVSDDVFPEALNLIVSAEQPNPALLMELGKYLFVSRRYYPSPDEEQNVDSFKVNNSTIVNFQDLRSSTIPDEVRDYIEGALKVLTTTNTAEFDPLAAYAIGYQLLPKAADISPDSSDRLREAVTQLQSLVGSGASQVQSQLSQSSIDPNSEDQPAKRAHVIAAVFNAAATGRFAEARELARGNDDLVSRNQIASLIDFAEAGASVSHKNIGWALSLANSLVPGIKRSLLYAGIEAASPDRDAAIGPFQLAIRDIERLPAEQRMFTLSANAGAIFPAGSDNAFTALSLLVAASNDAYTDPHRGYFDPKILRRPSKKAELGSDSPLILFNRRGLCEVVDTGQNRYTFPLKVPGATALNLPAVLPMAKGIDPARLEAVILDLRDETQMAIALNALAAMRLHAK
ncbi:MAG TPA: hypothetical protein VKU19_19060 [Bryobacteraceae bacterium]|nr:hypothetical protein [Bryobacteraceae bacterium]